MVCAKGEYRGGPTCPPSASKRLIVQDNALKQPLQNTFHACQSAIYLLTRGLDCLIDLLTQSNHFLGQCKLCLSSGRFDQTKEAIVHSEDIDSRFGLTAVGLFIF